MMKKPVVAIPKMRSYSYYSIALSFKNFLVIFSSYYLNLWSIFIKHNSSVIEKTNNYHYFDTAFTAKFIMFNRAPLIWSKFQLFKVENIFPAY